MATDTEMPDVPATLARIERARQAVQSAMGRGGKLLLSDPPDLDTDHDVVIWEALVEARRTINALEKAQHKLDGLRRVCAEILGNDVDKWPAHGNVPLAIASALQLATRRLRERDRAANA